MNLTGAEDMKKRWQEYRELYKKCLNDLDNHNDVITHLEPDIPEGEVKWALGSITIKKAIGGDGIPAELFQILKDNAVKVLHSICQQIWKIQQWPRDWKMSFFIPIPKKGNGKECPNYSTIALNSHASKVMLKILKVRVQQLVNQEFPDVQLDLEKAEESEIKLLTSAGSEIKQGNYSKTSTSTSLTTLKLLTVDHNKLWKILQDMGIPGHHTCLLRNMFAVQEATVRTRHGTIDWLKIWKGV